MLPPLLLSMGPDIVVFGQTIPMPYRILHALTNGMLRMPWRLAPIYVICAMIFVGMTWTPLLTHFTPPLNPLSMYGEGTSKKTRTPPRQIVERGPGGEVSWHALIFIALFIILACDVRIWQTGPLRPVLREYEFYETIGAEQADANDDNWLFWKCQPAWGLAKS